MRSLIACLVAIPIGVIVMPPIVVGAIYLLLAYVFLCPFVWLRSWLMRPRCPKCLRWHLVADKGEERSYRLENFLTLYRLKHHHYHCARCGHSWRIELAEPQDVTCRLERTTTR